MFTVLAGPQPTTGVGGTLSLVTLANFQAYINESSDSGGPKDTVHQTVLDAACRGAYNRMGGRYLLRPATEFDYVMQSQDDGSRVYLPQYPVGAISVLELGYMSADATWTSQKTVTSNEYYLDARSGILKGVWPLQLDSIRVKWTGGYTSAELPADAKEAVMIWAGVKYQRTLRSRWDIKSNSAGQESAVYIETDIPDYVAQILSQYTKPRYTFA